MMLLQRTEMVKTATLREVKEAKEMEMGMIMRIAMIREIMEIELIGLSLMKKN